MDCLPISNSNNFISSTQLTLISYYNNISEILGTFHEFFFVQVNEFRKLQDKIQEPIRNNCHKINPPNGRPIYKVVQQTTNN